MDSVEDFVFPKKTTRPVSPLPSEPVTVNNSFSDLESENDKDQVAPEENNETAPPNPKPPPPIHLKIKKNIRDQLKSIYQKFPDITNKSSGEFIKLITNNIEEYHARTNFFKEGKDFEFFSLKPKPIKPIKIVIKGLPIFTKTYEIQSDLEEEEFTIENLSQLISKKTKTALPFFQVTLPRATPIIKEFEKRKTTRREDRRIVRQALVDPTVTRSTIRADVGIAIVPLTISRHLAEANVKSKHPFRALPLTPEHRQLRLQWC
ncbi:uncharacterized protein TNCV_2649921 [Trichonephila clavipes]|nr:uncharacterized protein TNCV_2649921 [Trichonephila clavipes]